MVPTEFMAVAVAMLTDALSQLLYLGNEFFTCHLVKIDVHNVLPTERHPASSAVIRRARDSHAAQRNQAKRPATPAPTEGEGAYRPVRLGAWSGRSLSRKLPAREHQHGGMATECAGQHFGTLNTQPNTIVLDGRKRRLRNAAPARELVLTETLKLSNDPDGFSDRDFSALLSGTELTHLRLPVIA